MAGIVHRTSSAEGMALKIWMMTLAKTCLVITIRILISFRLGNQAMFHPPVLCLALDSDTDLDDLQLAAEIADGDSAALLLETMVDAEVVPHDLVSDGVPMMTLIFCGHLSTRYPARQPSATCSRSRFSSLNFHFL